MDNLLTASCIWLALANLARIAWSGATASAEIIHFNHPSDHSVRTVPALAPGGRGLLAILGEVAGVVLGAFAAGLGP